MKGKLKLEYTFSIFQQIWNTINSFFSNIGISFRWLFSISDQKWQYYNLSGSEGSTEPDQYIKKSFFIESAVRNLTVETIGRHWSDRDVDLYVSKNSTPTTSDYLKKSDSRYNDELISVNNPESGKNYIIMLYGYQAYENLYLRIEKYFEHNVWAFFAQFLKQYKVNSFIKCNSAIKEELPVEVYFDIFPPYDENWYEESWFTEGSTIRIVAPKFYEDASGKKYDLNHWENHDGYILDYLNDDSDVYIKIENPDTYYAVYSERKEINLHGVDSSVQAIAPSDLAMYPDGYPSGENMINGFPIDLAFGDFNQTSLTGESILIPDRDGTLGISNSGWRVYDKSAFIPGEDYRVRFAGWWDDKYNSTREFDVSHSSSKSHYTIRLDREVRFERNVHPDEVFPDSYNKLEAKSFTDQEIPAVTPWIPFSYNGVSLEAEKYLSAPSEKTDDGWKFYGWFLDDTVELGNSLEINYAFVDFVPFKISAYYNPTVSIEGICPQNGEYVIDYEIQAYSDDSEIKSVYTGISKIPVKYDSTGEITLKIDETAQTNGFWNATPSQVETPNVQYVFKEWEDGSTSNLVLKDMQPVSEKIYLDKKLKVQIKKSPVDVPLNLETNWKEYGTSDDYDIPATLTHSDTEKAYRLKFLKKDTEVLYSREEGNKEIIGKQFMLENIQSPILIEIEYEIVGIDDVNGDDVNDDDPNNNSHRFTDPKKKFIFTP